MKSEQKALIVRLSPEPTGLDALNELLAGGWHVVEMCPMGGAGGGGTAQAGALVVVARSGLSQSAMMMEEAEEQVEELLREAGDGGLGELDEPRE